MPSTSPASPAPVRAPRCWTLVGDEGAIDVEVTAEDSDTLGVVLAELRRVLRVPVEGLWNGSVRLSDDLPMTAPPLAHGACLGVGRPAVAAARGVRGSALELHVVGGPEAGRTLPLAQGEHVLGRGSEATVSLDDPDVSRRHVGVSVGGGRITVSDLGSSNGSRLDDDELGPTPRPWHLGAVLRIGTSALTIAGPAHAGVGTTPGRGGRTTLRPAPRLHPPVTDVEVRFPRPPAPPPPRRLAWVAVALPAVGGVLMAWLLSAPTFLFFALLSPVVAVGTWLSDRWTGRRSGRRDAAAHALEVVAAHEHLTEAVRAAVRAAEAAHPDLATVTTAARRRTALLWSRRGEDGDALTVRLGVGRSPTPVTRVDGEGARERQVVDHLPAVVDLGRDGGLAVVGPQEQADGVLASVVVQLAALLPPGSLDLVLLAHPARVASWQWARWLPHLHPDAVHIGSTDMPYRHGDERLRLALAARPHTARTDTARRWTVVLVDRPVDARLATALRDARSAGVLTLTTGTSPADLPVEVDAAFHLTGETGNAGRLHRRGLADSPVECVDRLPRAVAAAFARDLAGLTTASRANALPQAVRLVDLPTAGLQMRDDDTVTGSWSSARDRLRAVLGRTADGTVSIDLCADGPHALVAGTTGSGKSELLQTLIAGLALHHPPERCSFLLVDYKGGSAFADAVGLPHTVGMVTDLDARTTTRALRSLTAELTRRESILASHGVADVADLPPDVDLARLVIVVDEFATLAEELPTFVPGLVSIAQRGRSLGVHLVLATQRPAGVVSPEIRANCSLRICLRTTDEADSRDVLGTPAAAHLPVDSPGRAYLRTGNAEPTLFQTARVASTARPATATGPEVRRWAWPAPTGRPAELATGASDLARLRRTVVEHAGAAGVRLPHRPWRPPLPERIPVADLDEWDGEPDRPRTRLRLGLVDLPDSQRQVPLELDLADAGTWLAVGGPRSGRSTLLRTVLREAVSRLGPGELHVHLIESGGGSLGREVAALPHAGTVISGEDALRTVRLVERLADEVATRRASAGSADPARILLLVDGVEQVTTTVEEAAPGHGSALLARLFRDGGAVGVTCVLTGDRAIPGGRLAGLARHRLVLPLADRADYAVAGIPPRAVPEHRPPGRALLGEDAVECQLAQAREPWQPHAAPVEQDRPPLRIPELPSDPVVPAATPPDLVIGPGGDEGRPLTLDLFRSRGLLVAGSPGTGRTAALEAFTRDLLAGGTRVLRLGDPADADPGGSECVHPSDEAAVRAWVHALDGGPGVVVVDDLGTPAEFPGLAALGGPAPRVALIAAGQPAQLAAHFQGPVAALRRARTGLLLCPGPGDADLLGVRLPRMPLPARPGSGWLVAGGRTERVQVARQRGPRPA